MSSDAKKMKVEVCDAKTSKVLFTVDDLTPNSTVLEVKHRIHSQKKRLYPDRQALRAEVRGKALKDEDRLGQMGLKTDGQLYLRDLGPQIAWETVFLAEYFGPLIIYPVFFCFPQHIYGELGRKLVGHDLAVRAALGCWTFHYAKRLYETKFVHRFSHGTMPIMNLAKNCSYYWGFAAFISYFVNHPLYSPPMYGTTQIAMGIALFIIGELGNFSCHVALKNLRPPGTKLRRIPVPTQNPFTALFDYVSCPNYTYEAISWLGFSILTQCLPAFLFTVVGLGQMSIWALGKHRNYKKEFTTYPRQRKAIIPFLL